MSKLKGAAAVSDNIALIIVPLFAMLALAIQFVIIPVFASMGGVGGSASAGLMSMSATLASFAPIYGIGLGVGMKLRWSAIAINGTPLQTSLQILVLFFSLAAWDVRNTLYPRQWFGGHSVRGAAAVSDNIALIIVPLFAMLALAIQFVIIPVFASMGGVGASASAGLMSMSGTLASFAPIYGIGLGVGILVLFFSLAAIQVGTLYLNGIGLAEESGDRTIELGKIVSGVFIP